MIVAAIRSQSGASAELVRRVLDGKLQMVASVAIMLEYEAVATRPSHVTASGFSEATVLNIIDVLATLVERVNMSYRWRPQLRDADDEILLEAAVNAGCVPIVTFNRRDFVVGAKRFGIEILLPKEVLERLDQ